MDCIAFRWTLCFKYAIRCSPAQFYSAIKELDVLVRINEEFVHTNKWFRPVKILCQATSKSAELMALSSPRNPYSDKLGAFEEGAYVDPLLVKGNPLESIDILTRPKQNLLHIMKHWQHSSEYHLTITKKS